MKLSEVRLDGSWSFNLSLHPLVTVVSGLGPDRRWELAAVVASHLRGHPVEGCRLLAGDDPPVEVTPEELDLLEVPRDVEVRVLPSDLPGAVVKSDDPPEGGDEHVEGTGGAQVALAGSRPEDRAEVEAALRALRDARGQDEAPSPAALELLEEWESVERAWREAKVDSGSDARSGALRERLEQARLQLAAAEQYARPLNVDAEDQARLDHAHQKVLVEQEKAKRRLGGAAARRRLEAARAVETGILQRIGVPSYDAYLLRSSSLLGDIDAQDRLEAARRAVEEAEEAWELAALDEPPAVRELRRRRNSLLRQAADIAGRPVDPEELIGALSQVRVPIDDHEAAARLQAALDRVGVAVHRTLEEEAVAFLDQARADDRADRVRADAHPWVGHPPLADTAGVDAEDLEVYMLARFAAQRAVGRAGSLPLVLVDPFADLTDRSVDPILAMLQRLAPAVQVIFLSDDERVLRWASNLPREMGAVRLFGG